MSEHRHSAPKRSSSALLAVLLVLSLTLAVFFAVKLNRTKNEMKTIKSCLESIMSYQ